MTRLRTRALTLVAVAACAAPLFLLLLSAAPHPATAQGDGDSRVREGLAISPVAMNLDGKNPALVGLGSYYVNAVSDCGICHTWPNWAAGGNPFAGQPEKVNTARFLAGGRPFVPPGVISRDITPWKDGLPAGLTLDEFIQAMRTGHDSEDPTTLLEIMPWPWVQDMTDRDLAAVYEYLRSIPPIQPGPGAG